MIDPHNDYSAINVRLSHPTMYYIVMILAGMSVGLGLNFIFANPTFNPYGFPKEITGSIFFALGAGKIISLNGIRIWGKIRLREWSQSFDVQPIDRNLTIVRKVMTAEVIWMLFWGVGTTVTFFQGKTSLQLFFLYISMVAIEIALMDEPFLNPLTSRRMEGGA